MRHLHGFLFPRLEDFSYLKHYLLLYDKFYMHDVNYILEGKTPLFANLRKDTAFLLERGIFEDVSSDVLYRYYQKPPAGDPTRLNSERLKRMIGARTAEEKAAFDLERHRHTDDLVRRFSAALNQNLGFDTVPICLADPAGALEEKHNHSVLKIGLQMLPMPDELNAWQDILDFKAKMRDKEWGFQRFLRNLATKNQKPAEIEDEIEWMVNEYRKAMDIHHLKVSNSAIEVYVMPVIELMEDIVKFNWSKIAKGVLSVNKRKVDLMEAEMKAPGKECAYVFEARKRFASS